MLNKVIKAYAYDNRGELVCYDTPPGFSPQPDRQLFNALAAGEVLCGYAIYSNSAEGSVRFGCLQHNARASGIVTAPVMSRRGRVIYMTRAVDPDA